MNTNSYLQLGSIDTLVIHKQIKNLHLSVLPPNGLVRVTVPQGMKNDVIRTLLALRLPWIKRQQEKFTGQERQTKRDYSSGESHYLFGKRYRLEVIYKAESPTVLLKGKSKIILQIRPESLTIKRQEVMMDWYRKKLHIVGSDLIDKWQKRMGVQVKSWGIKQMKTRWGTCNPKNAKVLINLELAKKPIACLEYVIVHELLHLIEGKHDDKFVRLMTKYIPKWRSIKEELNNFILSYDVWKY